MFETEVLDQDIMSLLAEFEADFDADLDFDAEEDLEEV